MSQSPVSTNTELPVAEQSLSVATIPEAPEGFKGYHTRFRDTPLGQGLHRLFRVCASLQLALSMLTLFTCCLALATFLEAGFSARIAQELIYHTWWFAVLLGLLATNILCAALKKYPWKRYQIGFLITHSGLLVLVLGGLLNNVGGVEGQMMLIDSSDRELQQNFRLPNTSDTLQLANQQQIEVLRIPKEQVKDDEKLLRDIYEVVSEGIEPSPELKNQLRGNYWTVPFQPGSLTWKDDAHASRNLPFTLRALQRLANPFPGLTHKCNEQLSLTVENFYPFTERWPFSPPKTDEEGFPALLLKLTTPMAHRPFTRWVTSMPNMTPDAMPVGFEMYVLEDPALLPEFLSPPPPVELGKEGELVLVIGYRRIVCRLNLDEIQVDQTIPLRNTALQFRLKRRGHLMDLLAEKPEERPKPGPHGTIPPYPAVEFELIGPGGTGTYMTCARVPHMPIFRGGQDLERVGAWYHYPDFSWGEMHRLGSVQFLKGPGGKLYYRVYGKDGLLGKGVEIDPRDTEARHRIPFSAMQMEFQVDHWMPLAVRREQYRPKELRPGTEPSKEFEPALRCTLMYENEPKEFWVRMGRGAVKVNAGRDIFFVRYRQDTRPVPFTLQLTKAQQVSDPGTSRAAAYQSNVVLRYPSGGQTVEQEHQISMNHTLDHGGFKVYQTNYQPLINPQSGAPVVDPNGRLVSMSGFTVADDPGLWCKYLGSFLLVLGIATMFYMKAYFFKRRPATGQTTV